jgi:pyruvate-formate lyase-activating enzyme
MRTNEFVPDISSLYRLPYSKNDNPNGWIEVTTDCNLRCPGCYRGCNREDSTALHEPVGKIKEEILEMQRIRNCQIISLSGGEPLLYPDLLEVISFIKTNGMHPFVHTNGILLTPDLLKEMKEAGLAGVIIRVDSLSRSRAVKEEDLNTLRQRYGEMVYALKGIHLTLLCVVDHDNLPEIGSIIQWSLANERLIDFITFIPIRQVRFIKDEPIDSSKWIYTEDLCKEVYKLIPDIKYASFLGSRLENDSIRWLQAPWVVLNKKILGYPGPKFVESFQVLHHLIRGKYAYKFGKDRNYLNIIQVFFLSLFIRSFRTIFWNFLLEILKNPFNLFKKSTLQLLCYIIPPASVKGLEDECDGCPDAMLYKGRLVPSCALEEFKLFGKTLEHTII